MIIGFKGENSKLNELYKELGLTEKKAENIEAIADLVKSAEDIVIVNYNELMVCDNPTADIVERKTKILKLIESCKKNLYLGLTKNDTSLDKVKIDMAISTKVDTKDMKEIEELFDFLNSDLAYNDKLSDGEYAVKLSSELRAEAYDISKIKSLLKK